MTKFRRAILATPLIFATTLLPAAQNHHNNNAYYSGMRDGASGGRYYDNRDRPYHYDHRQPNQGGIGPGKGALIGGAGGAVLGAVFGGGLKGTIVGGAAGAGIGAIAGEVHQNNQRRDDRYYPRH